MKIRDTYRNRTDVCGVSGVCHQSHGIREVNGLHIGLAACSLVSVLVAPDKLKLALGIPRKTCVLLTKTLINVGDQGHIDLDASHTEELCKHDLLGVGVHRKLSRGKVSHDLAVVKPVLHDEVGEGLHSRTADSIQILAEGRILRGNSTVLRDLVVVGVEVLHDLRRI